MRPALFIGVLAAAFAGAQTTQSLAGTVEDAKTPVVTSVAPKAPAKQWKTPWGDPDLQGTWSNATTTPLERLAKYQGREFLTKEERIAENKETEVGRDKRDAKGSRRPMSQARITMRGSITDGRTGARR